MITYADLSWFENKDVRQTSWTARTSRAGDPFIIARLAHEGASGKVGSDTLHNYAAISVFMREVKPHRYWRNGRPMRFPSKQAGMLDIFDRRHAWWVEADCSVDCAKFYVPMSMLDDLAEDGKAPRIETLSAGEGMSAYDPVLHQLASVLLPTLDHQHETNCLFADHVASAIIVHVAQRYGGFEARAPSRCGGLAPWQERRAKAYIAENLDGNIDMAELAGMCGLSASHFRQAFRQTTGMPPHQWLLEQRVAKAKTLLVGTTATLGEISLSTGFADQSHFTRVFSRRVKASPAAWRRAQLS